MRKISSIFLMLMLLFSISTISFADNTPKYGVFDEGDYLTSSEEEYLTELLKSKSSTDNISYVCLITGDTCGLSSMVYSDNFYDNLIFNESYTMDGLLLFIDLDNNMNYVNSAGDVVDTISNKELDHILDEAAKFEDTDYVGCFESMVNESSYAYHNESKSSNNDSSRLSIYDKADIVLFGYPISSLYLLFSIIFIVMKTYSDVLEHNKANKVIEAKHYLKDNNIQVKNRQEKYIRTYTTVDKDYYKPKSSSSGGSGSHRSSSGVRHGGGGRSR